MTKAVTSPSHRGTQGRIGTFSACSRLIFFLLLLAFQQGFRFYHHTGPEQLHVLGRNILQVDPDRDALLYLDEVAGRVIGRDEGCLLYTSDAADE